MAATINSAQIASGKWKVVWLPKKASTLLSANVLVDLTAGFVVEAGTGSGGNNQPLVGINLGGTQAAADATTALIPIAVPAEPHAYAQLLIDTGTPSATADIGKPFDISATGGVTFSTSTRKCVSFVKYLSATQGIFKIESVHPIVA
jgi:hypothetical protein